MINLRKTYILVYVFFFNFGMHRNKFVEFEYRRIPIQTDHKYGEIGFCRNQISTGVKAKFFKKVRYNNKNFKYFTKIAVRNERNNGCLCQKGRVLLEEKSI